MARNQGEHTEQVALFKWAAANIAKYPQLKFMFAIPNGGKRNIQTARKLKAEGVKPGIPDIFLPVPKYHQHGLFIEMKFGKNKQTPAQKEVMSDLIQQGYACVVCYSWIESVCEIERYLK